MSTLEIEGQGKGLLSTCPEAINQGKDGKRSNEHVHVHLKQRKKLKRGSWTPNAAVGSPRSAFETRYGLCHFC